MITIEDVKRIVKKEVPGAYAKVIYENPRYFIVTMGAPGVPDDNLVANGAAVNKETGAFELISSNPLYNEKWRNMAPGKVVYKE